MNRSQGDRGPLSAGTGPDRVARLAALVIPGLVLVACSLAPGLALPAATDPAAARRHAAAVLEAWSAAAEQAGGAARVSPVGELTTRIGDWEPAVADRNARALAAGAVLTDSPLPDDAPAEGEVTWPDGTTTRVPLLQAQQAIVAIGTSTAPTCPDCGFLLATSARLVSGPIQTTRGPAIAPLWEFTLQDTAVRLTRVAIGNAPTAVPPEADPALGLAIEAAGGSVTGTDLTVAFTGSPEPGSQPCGEDYTGEAIESELAVVVIVTRHPHVGGAVSCTAEGARRTATATLAAPLGDRAVLDFQAGAPVPLALAP